MSADVQVLCSLGMQFFEAAGEFVMAASPEQAEIANELATIAVKDTQGEHYDVHRLRRLVSQALGNSAFCIKLLCKLT